MAKGMYVGVSGVTRKAKKFYVGVGGVARKVKKIYVGVNGVARLAWSGAFLSKYTGVISPLSEAKWQACSASNGSYALFAGGFNIYYYADTAYYTYLTSVDAYNASLVKTVAPAMTNGKGSNNGNGGGRVGQYAYFGTGETPTGSHINYANAYNQALVRSDFTDTIQTVQQVVQQNDLNNPTYAICGYGFYNDGQYYNPQGQHYGINSSLVKSYFYDVAVLRTYVGAACVGGQVIIAGGDDRPLSWSTDPNIDLKDIVSAFNSSYVKTSLAVLSSKRNYCKGICNNNYAMFVGGRGGGNNPISTIDVYNTSLVKLTPLDYGGDGASQINYAQNSEFALTPGGTNLMNGEVYGIDNSLVRTFAGNSSIAHPRGTTVGDYIVFGGNTGANNYNTVEAFKTT
ncbi:MAG: hypothetical protein K0R05_2437 [Anaerocolumna sp.]|jgi:hypothetical protein|nr:hypothetical protein [Anaerocolumna sp.]